MSEDTQVEEQDPEVVDLAKKREEEAIAAEKRKAKEMKEEMEKEARWLRKATKRTVEFGDDAKDFIGKIEDGSVASAD